MPSPLRLSPALVADAERESILQKRSVPKQIEFWAELGKAVEQIMDISDVFAIIQGFKRLKIESLESTPIASEDVFDSLESNRKMGTLSENVTSSAVYYEKSHTHPGLVDQVDSSSGNRLAGRFQDGEFRAVS